MADGFEQCKAEPCTVRKIVGEVVVTVNGVCVDGLLVGGAQEDCLSLLLSLNKRFPTNDLGECTSYDGCGMERKVRYDQVVISSIRR